VRHRRLVTIVFGRPINILLLLLLEAKVKSVTSPQICCYNTL